MVGTINSGTKPTRTSSSNPIFGGAFAGHEASLEGNQYVYVQLRPGTQMVRKCLDMLARITSDDVHASSPYSLAGVTYDHHACMLTFAVDFGDRTKVATAQPGDQAINAFNLISAIYKNMFDFLPQFVSAPDEHAQHNAADLVESLTAHVADAAPARLAG